MEHSTEVAVQQNYPNLVTYRECTNVKIVKYEKLYISFLFISAIGVLSAGLLSTIGVLYVLVKYYDNIIVGNSVPFEYCAGFLLSGNCLCMISGTLTCVASKSPARAKFLMTVFFGHIVAIGLTISGLLIITQYLSKIDVYPIGRRTLLMPFYNTVNITEYRTHWIRIHEEYRCCGVESVKSVLMKLNDSEKFKITPWRGDVQFLESNGFLKNTEAHPDFSCNQKSACLFFIRTEVDTKGIIVEMKSQDFFSTEKLLNQIVRSLGININFCTDLPNEIYRGCGEMNLWMLEVAAKILKLCSKIVLSQIVVASFLCIFRYIGIWLIIWTMCTELPDNIQS